jgi:hypothetical protein
VTKSSRKSSSKKGRDRKDPVHKREEQDSSLANDASEHEAAAGVSKKSAASRKRGRDKSGEELVHEVSGRLVRLESRRQARVFAKRLFWVVSVAAVIAVLWYFFGDRFPTELMQEYWDEIKQKLVPAQPASLE